MLLKLIHRVKALEEDCRESRMRENRMYGLTRGRRDLFSSLYSTALGGY
jgi:hypothetical protein